jgi:SAM-dependent methyltransferase
VSLVVDAHREYLSDPARLSAFARAIQETVKPGDVVVDLGAGTGILGLLACRAGARKVYAIDAGGMIEVARAICRANGFGDRVEFIKDVSTRATLPERADVIVADQIGRFGFEAGVLQFFADARARLLKPGGAIVPTALELWVAPVESPELFAQVEFWKTAPGGFDFQPARSWAANTGYPAKLRGEQLLGDPAAGLSLDLSRPSLGKLALAATVSVTRAGTLHGVGGWFSARLSPSVTMSNSPLAAAPIKRRNVFFPIDEPVSVAPGDQVKVDMRILPRDTMVRWDVELWRGGARQARFSHSTFHGMLLSAEDLRRTHPGFVPKLTAWGQARLTVLTLCDGQRSVAEVEAELQRRHPELFRTAAEAAEFAAEVITRYSA